MLLNSTKLTTNQINALWKLIDKKSDWYYWDESEYIIIENKKNVLNILKDISNINIIELTPGGAVIELRCEGPNNYTTRVRIHPNLLNKFLEIIGANVV